MGSLSSESSFFAPPLNAPAAPRYFRWVAPSLGGLPRPGLIEPLEQDLHGLVGAGVDVLITLEEQRTVDSILLRGLNIESRFFPIPDRGSPSLPAAFRMCSEVEELIERGKSVAFHCRAGYGRTGTMLAAQLIYRGEHAVTAIRHVRSFNRFFVQSDAQEEFLRAFDLHCRMSAN